MSNRTHLNLTPIDRMIAEMSQEERHQLILDFNDFETGDTIDRSLLRTTAKRVYETLHHTVGFDASYMNKVAFSAHKLNSLDAIREREDFELSDRKTLAVNMAEAIAALPTAREAAIDNAAEEGATAENEAELSDVVDRFITEGLQTTQSDTLDEYIRQAREILGVPTMTAEEELARLAPEDDPQP